MSDRRAGDRAAFFLFGAAIGAAAALKKHIVQVRIDPSCKLPEVVATLQATSLQLPKQIGRLAKQLKRMCMA